MKRFGLSVAVVLAVLLAACSSGGSGTGSASNGQVNLVMWMGFTPPPPASQGAEYTSLKAIVTKFTKLHPNIHIRMEYVNSDYALQKVTVALQGGQQPDISYQYGTNMPQVATASQVVNLTNLVKQAKYGWSDFVPGERAVATVNGKVLGIPALVDNLAVVYNKTLFAQHHLTPPGPGWTWSQLAADAKAISDPSKKIFGLTFPADGSETTVWEYEAMLWEAGGHILTSDNKKAAFNSPAGVKALTQLRQLQQAHALYLDFHPDAGTSETLFNSGKLGMIITGPWDLSTFPDVHYGVQIMPSWSPGGSHQTISGPDNWVVFNNGPARVNASLEFLRYLTLARQPAAELHGHRGPADQALGAEAARLRRLQHQVPGGGRVRHQPEERGAGAAADHPVPAGVRGAGPGGGRGAARAGHPAGRPELGRAAGRQLPGRPLTCGGCAGSWNPITRPAGRSRSPPYS